MTSVHPSTLCVGVRVGVPTGSGSASRSRLSRILYRGDPPFRPPPPARRGRRGQFSRMLLALSTGKRHGIRPRNPGVRDRVRGTSRRSPTWTSTRRPGRRGPYTLRSFSRELDSKVTRFYRRPARRLQERRGRRGMSGVDRGGDRPSWTECAGQPVLLPVLERGRGPGGPLPVDYGVPTGGVVGG